MELYSTISKILSTVLQWQWNTIALLIGSIGTLAIAFVTYKTVLEMKKNREQNIAPNLFVLPPLYKYQFRWIPLENLQSIISPQLAKDVIETPESRLPVFRLKNIGSGPAKNIKLEWSLIEQSINNICSNSQILKKYNVNLGSRLISISNNTNSWSTCYADQFLQTIDFCIPSYNPEFTDSIEMPSEIEGSYTIRLMTIDKPNDFNFLIAPTINLSINYEDLHGKQYKKNFLVESTLMYLPDNVSSDKNSVKTTNFSPDNIRGTITFKVR